MSSTGPSCSTSWQPNGQSTATTFSSLSNGTYYWQVRATVDSSLIYADGGTWWTFIVGPPPFAKSAPASGTALTGNLVTLSWATVTSASYLVCVGTSHDGTCHTGWFSTSATSVAMTGLAPGTYYWQARAVTSTTTTDADGATWWSFTVPTPAFTKTAPAAGATGLATYVPMNWGSATGATNYDVCVTTTGPACDTAWQSNAASTATGRTLTAGTYYWQVRATVSGSSVYADNGTWNVFTVGTAAATFGKVSPANGDSLGINPVTLSWSAVNGAAFELCVGVTTDNVCHTAWINMGTATSATLSGLGSGTFYWQVRATTTTTREADAGTWWSFSVNDPAVIDLSAATAPSGSWVFAEGAVGGTNGFSTYYLIANENSSPVRVRAWVVQEGVTQPTFVEATVPAQSRATVDLSTLVNGVTGSYAIVIQSVPDAAENIPSGLPIYVARTMYWGGASGLLSGAGHVKTGWYVPAGGTLPTQWYFAEGTRLTTPGGLFDTYYIVFNPTQTDATVTVQFVADDGTGVITSVTQTVAKQSRWTLAANQVAALAGKNFAALVTSTVGVLAERTMYWGTNWSGGHDAIGSPAAGPDWYFAEGTAMTGFNTYYLLFNPNATSVTVDATYNLAPVNGVAQTPVTTSYTLAPSTRRTLYLANQVSGTQTGVAAEFHTEGGASVVVERSMYWGTGWTEGSTAMGAETQGIEWHVPEGSTMSGYETYILLANFNTSPVTVTLTTYSDAGTTATQTIVIPAKTRRTLWMNNQVPANGPVFSNIVSNAFSTKVVSSDATPLPIVVEEAVYWTRVAGSGQFWRGGDATPAFLAR